MEDLLFGETKEKKRKKLYVLVIYDITDTKRRNSLAKYLNGFGFRVQKSAYESILTDKQYHQLIRGLPSYAKASDSIRVYRWSNPAKVAQFGKTITIQDEDIYVV